MCAVEHLGRMCRYHFRTREVCRDEVSSYGSATIKLESSKTLPHYTLNFACAVLRVLGGYMTEKNWRVECSVRVVVQDTEIASVLVWNPNGKGGVASMDTT